MSCGPPQGWKGTFRRQATTIHRKPAFSKDQLQQKKLLELFREKFIAAAGNLKPGLLWEPGVSLAPLPEPTKTAYLQGLVEDALRHGTKVLNPHGGEVHGSFFFTQRESAFLTTGYIF
ncbi:MAG: hypothetical protein JXB05_26200 [Myxococcaceae bacterium]|nr:hypothetical protein [Myxococcaceae bacterium]